ncbi:MAG TPA: hypothetical protein PKA06_10980, partial [Gemmatales bacterium]|nr:hypothetical protein [Gemmatales bacterium]
MWRFLGFVALVIAGLAAVFYYKGQAEEKNVVQQAVKKEAARMVVSSPLEASKNPEVVVTEVPQATSIGTFGSSIVIQAELKPREEQEVIFEVENLTTPIEQIFKGIGAEV